MRAAAPILFVLLNLIDANMVAADDELRIDSIDQFLATEEAKFDDLVPGTERSVRWFNGRQQTDLSIIYLHGFSASSKEISPTVERLADQLNANLYYTRLAGHGRSDDAMLDGNVRAWLNNTRQAYKIGAMIGKKVIVISTSTGGTLATWLVSQDFADKLLTNIMISPNYGVNSKLGGIVRWSLGLAFAKWLKGPYYSFEPLSDLHAYYWTERYPIEALPPMFELLDTIEGIDKSRIELPQLVIFSANDQVVNPAKIEKTIKQFSHSEVTIKRFKNSTDPYQHVLAGDAVSPESTAEMVKIIFSYVNSLID